MMIYGLGCKKPSRDRVRRSGRDAVTEGKETSQEKGGSSEGEIDGWRML